MTILTNIFQYYSRFGTRLFIDRMTATDQESVVSGVWVNILTGFFSSNNLYHVRPERFTHGGPTDLCVLQLITINGQQREYEFLIIQCKRMSGESQNVVWDDALVQIEGYLQELKPTDIPHRVYGVVAVGRWAQFVEYDR